MSKSNAGSRQLHLTSVLSNSSLTYKYKFLEASDKPYIQMFDFQITFFYSDSGGGFKYIYFPCKKVDFILMEMHVHL